MGTLRTFLLLFCFLGLAGCASQEVMEEEQVKFHVSDRAKEIIEEQGKASAVMLGYVRGTDTDLICERFYKTGSHITTNVCYTRGEREQRLLNHQETWRKTTQGGPCIDQSGIRGMGAKNPVSGSGGCSFGAGSRR